MRIGSDIHIFERRNEDITEGDNLEGASARDILRRVPKPYILMLEVF